MTRVLVDMSFTLIHHGHIRLLKKAKAHGNVVVALTTDIEIRMNKGYDPELDYDSRYEILSAIKYVDEIVPSPWLIDESFLDMHNIDLLVHGHDNSNPIASEKLLIVPRTEGISSTILRGRVLKVVADSMLEKERK